MAKKKSSKGRKKLNFAGNSGKSWIPYAVIIVLGIAVYAYTATFDFTGFDDYKIIVQQHEEINQFADIPGSFTETFGNLYRPVLRISWIIDASIGGTDPAVYHISNIIYHLIASCLFFTVLTRLRFERYNSFLISLLFTLHPVLTGAVAWIPGRNDTLLAIWIFLAFISLLNIIEKRRYSDFILHFIFFAAAVFTKETAVLFPLIALFFVLIVRKNKINEGKIYALAAGWIFILGLWFKLREAAVALVSSSDITGWEAFRDNIITFPAITGKVLVPFNLSGMAVVDMFSVTIGLIMFVYFLYNIFMSGISKESRSRIIFGFLWFVLFLLPSLYVRMQIAPDYYDYLEHRIYLPLAGMLFMLLEIFRSYGIDLKKSIIGKILIVVIILFGVRTVAYTTEFENRLAFWSTAAEKYPERANFHSVLGTYYFEKEDYQKAKQQFEKATELTKTHDADFYNNLGAVYAKLDQPQKAIDMYEKAFEVEPEKEIFHHLLGRLYYKTENFEKAQKHLKQYVKTDPAAVDDRIHLISIYNHKKEYDKAIDQCMKILEVDPGHFHAYNILATLYQEKGNIGKSIEMLKKAVEIRPDHLPGYRQLVKLLINQGRMDEAREYALILKGKGDKIPQQIKNLLNLQ